MALAVELPTDDELWCRYRRDGDVPARDQLFLAHRAWAGVIARSVYRRLSIRHVDCADFVQNAELGLLDAMSRFDPARGIEFRAFARARVRGAVFNGLRAMLQDRGISQDDRRYAERLAHMHGDHADAFDTIVDAIVGLGIGYLLDHAGDHAATDAYAYASRTQTHARLMAAIARLPERLRELVEQHYFHHIPFSEIAHDLGVTRGRMSQLHRDALQRLREALRELG